MDKRSEKAQQKRYATKRENKHERREDMSTAQNCIENCTLAAKNTERLNAAFSRIDEEREERRDLEKKVNEKFEKHNGYIQERIRFQLFIWIIGAHISLSGGLMWIMWNHFGQTGDNAAKAIERMETSAIDNARDIKVAITRIDDFINTRNESIRRNESDQGRILTKLDDIERSVRELQINFGALQQSESIKKEIRELKK